VQVELVEIGRIDRACCSERRNHDDLRVVGGELLPPADPSGGIRLDNDLTPGDVERRIPLRTRCAVAGARKQELPKLPADSAERLRVVDRHLVSFERGAKRLSDR